MTVTLTDGKPQKVISGDIVYEGYWTGDYECGCFADAIEPIEQDREGRQYPDFPGLDPNKRYRVEMHYEATELP